MTKHKLVYAIIALTLLVVTSYHVWNTQMVEIRLCWCVKDFYQKHKRIPTGLEDLPEQDRAILNSGVGQNYVLHCNTKPNTRTSECSLNWTSENHSNAGRNCGSLDSWEFTDFF